MPNNGKASRKPFQRQPYRRTVKLNGRKGRLLKIGAFWGRKDKNGRMYLAGKVGQMNALVFENSYKEKDTHPDYFLYVPVDPLEEDLKDTLDVADSPKQINTLPLPGGRTLAADSDDPVAPRYLIVEDAPYDESDADDDDWEL